MAYRWTDPNQTPGLSPELHLLAAVLSQAVKDAQSRRLDIREEALAFLHDAGALGWWSAALGLPDALLVQHIRATLGAGR